MLYKGSMEVPYESPGKIVLILKRTDKRIPLIISIKPTNQYVSLLIDPNFTSVLIQFEKEFSTMKSKVVDDHLPKYSLLNTQTSNRYGQVNVFYYTGYRDFYDPNAQ